MALENIECTKGANTGWEIPYLCLRPSPLPWPPLAAVAYQVFLLKRACFSEQVGCNDVVVNGKRKYALRVWI